MLANDLAPYAEALPKVCRVIVRHTDSNRHTLAVISGLRFLFTYVLKGGTTEHTMARAKAKALRELQVRHEQRGHILFEETQYRHQCSVWLDQMADAHMTPADAATLKGAY